MKTPRRILVVDDEETWIELLKAWLESGGYGMKAVKTGLEALQTAQADVPDCVVLDYSLPDMSGLDVCRRLRSHPATRFVPVVLLSGRTKEKVSALQSGADAFVAKSENPAEFLAVLAALFRRRDMDQDLLSLDDVGLDPKTRGVLWRDERAATLTPKLFELLYSLVLRSPEPVSREELFLHLEGTEEMGASRALDVMLNRLRKALPVQIAERIKNVKGFGYLYLPSKR